MSLESYFVLETKESKKKIANSVGVLGENSVLNFALDIASSEFLRLELYFSE